MMARCSHFLRAFFCSPPRSDPEDPSGKQHPPGADDNQAPPPQQPQPAADDNQGQPPKPPQPAADDNQALSPKPPQPAADDNQAQPPKQPQPAADDNQALSPKPPKPAADDNQAQPPKPPQPAADDNQAPPPQPPQPAADDNRALPPQPPQPAADDNQALSPKPPKPAADDNQALSPKPPQPAADDNQALPPQPPQPAADDNQALPPQPPQPAADDNQAPPPKPPQPAADDNQAPPPQPPQPAADDNQAPPPQPGGTPGGGACDPPDLPKPGSSPPNKLQKGSLLQRVKQMARNGLTNVNFLLEELEWLADVLPPPGPYAAKGLKAVLKAIEGAADNKDNLLELRDRALGFMDFVVVYKKSLEEIKYRQVMTDFNACLEEITNYAKKYGQCYVWMRLVTSGQDRAEFERLMGKLNSVSDALLLGLAADNHQRVLGQGVEITRRQDQLQQDVREVLVLLKSERPSYKEPAAVRKVEELGGMDKVLADDRLLAQVIEELETGTRLTVELVRAVLRSEKEEGPHRVIIQSDLRLLWKNEYHGFEVVPWSEFKKSLPQALGRIATFIGGTEVQQICDVLLSTEAAWNAFQRAVNTEKDDKVSVWELKHAFNNDDGSLLEQVKKKVGVATEGALVLTGRVQLPELPPYYDGRDVDAKKLVNALTARGAILLLAEGGMGKSTLATDVGRRLVKADKVPAGVRWVDLREAHTPTEMEARFGAALGIKLAGAEKTAEKTNNADFATEIVRAAIACMAVRSNSGGGAAAAGSSSPTITAGGAPSPLLLVVDNAEDALVRKETAEALRGLLAQLMEQASGLRLLITSRQPILTAGPSAQMRLPLVHKIEGISAKAATNLVMSICGQAVTNKEAGEVAKVCGGVPLALRMVAEALLAGRLTFEEVNQITAEKDVSSTAAIAASVLRSLESRHRQAAIQLAVFPSVFDLEGAAALLEMSDIEVRGYISALCRHGVLQHASGQKYSMHMLVREEVVRLAEPDEWRQAEAAFVAHMLEELRKWTSMYYKKDEWRVAMTAMLRDREPDVRKLVEILRKDPGKRVDWSPVEAAHTILMTQPLTAFEIYDLNRSCGALLGRLEEMGTDGWMSPEQEQERQLAMADVLQLLADYSKAAALRALSIRHQYLGREHEATVEALAALARGNRSDSPQLADRLFRQALHLSQQAGRGMEHPVIRRVASRYSFYLSGLSYAFGTSTDEEPVREGDLSWWEWDVEERQVPPPDPLKEAEELMVQVAAACSEALGEDHPDTIASYEWLAEVHMDQGKLREAAADYRRMLQAILAAWGEEYYGNQGLRRSIAHCLTKAGEFQEAESVLRERLAVEGKRWGEDSERYRQVQVDLADCLRKQGRHSEAEELAVQVAAASSEALGEHHHDTIWAYKWLADVRKDQGKLREAVADYRRALQVSLAAGDEEGDGTQGLRRSIAHCLTEAGEFQEAESVLQERLAVAGKLYGEVSWGYIKVQLDLADCLRKQGRCSEAEELAVQLATASSKALGEHHPDTIEPYMRLAEVHMDQGKLREAAADYRRALQVSLAAWGEEAGGTQWLRERIADCLTEAGEFQEAESVLREPLAVVGKLYGEDSEGYLEAQLNLADWLRKQGRCSEAEELYRQVLRAANPLEKDVKERVMSGLEELAGAAG